MRSRLVHHHVEVGPHHGWVQAFEHRLNTVMCQFGMAKLVYNFNTKGYLVDFSGGFHSHGGTPIAGWLISMGKQHLFSWMRTGGSPMTALGHHPIRMINLQGSSPGSRRFFFWP